MEFTQLLENRRSIRAYKENTQISVETVKELIAAAQQAPSWKNSQTGRYYAVSSKEMLARVKAECLPEFNQRNSRNAPLLIVTAFVKGIAGFDNDASPVNELGDEWGAYDLGLQNSLLILKARELGLDTLIMGIRDEVKLRELLGIPESEEVVSVIAVGYRDIEPKKPVRKEIEEILKLY
ncbi:MAG: nitroreductase family protein [Lachnospiraceae bacterium]|nr:nitroreductase family protein [Lachnospiraceae bacterium]